MSRPRSTSAPARAIAASRPGPPDGLRVPAFIEALEDFAPDPALWAWIASTFLNPDSPLHNAEHAHLRQARVGILWTNVDNARQMRSIVGTAEIPIARSGGAWGRSRHDLQLRRWFGEVPDFLITLSAPYVAQANDATVCAVIDHELYHCAQARGAYGVPLFSRTTGKPLFAIRGHDVEQFVGVARRWGPEAAGVLELVAAASATPLIAGADIAAACGTCLARAA